MGIVLAAQVKPQTIALLSADAGSHVDVSFEELGESNEIIARLSGHGDGVEAVMLGPELQRPLQIAQRVKTTDQDLAVLVLSDPDEVEQLRDAIRFTPFLGGGVSCCSTGDAEDLANTLREALTLTRTRRAYRGMVSAVQSRVTTLSLPHPPPAQLLDRLLIHAPIGVVVLDDAGIVVDLNRKAQNILDIEGRRVVGTRWRERFPENVLGDVDAFRKRSSTADQAQRVEVFALRRKEGQTSFVETRAAEVQGRAGNRFLMLILQDVTDRKRLEREQEQFTETLEQRVADRTRELAVAKNALEQSNEELQQFAHIASHDLQTPLRSIGAFAEILQKDYQGRLDEQADQYINRMVDGVKLMKNMIDDLLVYSRVESRAVPFQRVNVSQVCDEVVTLIQTSIEDVGGEVTRDELPTIQGDRSQMAHLLQNLIGNGIKYHGDNPPRVHLSAQFEDDMWTFSVRDNGIGIDAKYHEQIFELFKRLHTAQEYPGTGIGLALCRRIVHRHGGRIWLASESGKGTTIYFELPARASKES